MKWHYMDTEGRPKKEGVYWVTLIFSGWDREKQEPNNERLVTVETRYFGSAEANSGWVMEDEPEEGNVWTEECGSMPNERVWAWAEMEETPFPDRLPDGVKKWEG